MMVPFDLCRMRHGQQVGCAAILGFILVSLCSYLVPKADQNCYAAAKFVSSQSSPRPDAGIAASLVPSQMTVNEAWSSRLAAIRERLMLIEVAAPTVTKKSISNRQNALSQEARDLAWMLYFNIVLDSLRYSLQMTRESSSDGG
jgi:hypothetical protein